ncbi:MAG: PepSY domain-containing protein [Sulfobacillus sp.]
MKSPILTLGTAGAIALALALGSGGVLAAAQSHHSTRLGQPPAVTMATADQTALTAVGGGTVTHTSNDTYQGQAVYDIHIADNNQVWDVKVSAASGAVVQKKLSAEQPTAATPANASSNTATTSTSPAAVSATAADQAALTAVGGGTVARTSNDTYQGQAVYDIHITYNNQVWNVKVSAASGAVVQKKLSAEQSASQGSESNVAGSAGSSKDTSGVSGQKSPDTNAAQSESGNQPAVVGGITFNQKLNTAPAAYSAQAAQAVSSVGGVSLKWVKFDEKKNGDIQMNVKVNLANGTTKVQDLFSPTGQLLSQNAQSES